MKDTQSGAFGFQPKDLPQTVNLGAQPLKGQTEVPQQLDLKNDESPHSIHSKLLNEQPPQQQRNLVEEFPQFKPVHLRNKPLATPVPKMESVLSDTAMQALANMESTSGVVPAPMEVSIPAPMDTSVAPVVNTIKKPIPAVEFEGSTKEVQKAIPAEPELIPQFSISQKPNPGYIDVPANASAEAVPVNLPSRFAFYGFKDLYVYPLKGKHLAKFARAAAEHSIRLTVEAVSSVCVTTSPEFQGKSLAHMLTVQDFYYLMYFLRKANFPKTELRHTAYCSNKDHLMKVAKGEMPEESLKILETVQHTQLIVTDLETVPEYNKDVMGSVALRAATMMDTIEWAEDPRFDNEEIRWLGHCASYIVGSTFAERISIAENLSAEQIQHIMDYERAFETYGVEERLTVKCRGCGASMKTTVNIDAHSFLPS